VIRVQGTSPDFSLENSGDHIDIAYIRAYFAARDEPKASLIWSHLARLR
jgi:hypothetical protein